MTSTPQPPPQLSEGTFRVYEPYIALAVRNWPDETRFDPSDMVNEKRQRRIAPATFAARMRDALVSLRQYGWSTFIPLEKLEETSGQALIAYDKDGSVWFRNRARRGRPLAGTPAKGTVVGTSPGPTANEIWAEWDTDTIKSAVILIHQGFLTGPVIFPGKVEDTAALEDCFNVSFFFDSSRNQTILT